MGAEGTRSQINLPPGFRFYPTDEELVVHYLCKKVASQPFAMPVIAEVELYKFNPWDLPEKALFGEKEWYFFSHRDRKYPNGSRPNRAAASGYWKATGTDKSITGGGGGKVGVKKTLVFYEGRPTKGVRTDWIMHEYSLADSASRDAKRKGSLRLDDWVLCRVYKKVYSARKGAVAKKRNAESSWQEDASASLPEIDDTKALINLSRIDRLNKISSLRSAMQHDHRPFHNVAQANGAAANSGGGGRRVMNTGQPAWRNSVGCCPNLAKNGRKVQRCNGATDANPAVVAEAGCAGMRPTKNQGQNHVHLGSRAPALLQMDCSLWEKPRMSMETTAEEILQISDSPLQMLFGLGLSDRLYAEVEPSPPLADDGAFFATF